MVGHKWGAGDGTHTERVRGGVSGKKRQFSLSNLLYTNKQLMCLSPIVSKQILVHTHLQMVQYSEAMTVSLSSDKQITLVSESSVINVSSSASSALL